jgi:hypothetical protein
MEDGELAVGIGVHPQLGAARDKRVRDLQAPSVPGHRSVQRDRPAAACFLIGAPGDQPTKEVRTS